MHRQTIEPYHNLRNRFSCDLPAQERRDLRRYVPGPRASCGRAVSWPGGAGSRDVELIVLRSVMHRRRRPCWSSPAGAGAAHADTGSAPAGCEPAADAAAAARAAARCRARLRLRLVAPRAAAETDGGEPLHQPHRAASPGSALRLAALARDLVLRRASADSSIRGMRGAARTALGLRRDEGLRHRRLRLRAARPHRLGTATACGAIGRMVTSSARLRRHAVRGRPAARPAARAAAAAAPAAVAGAARSAACDRAPRGGGDRGRRCRRGAPRARGARRIGDAAGHRRARLLSRPASGRCRWRRPRRGSCLRALRRRWRRR